MNPIKHTLLFICLLTATICHADVQLTDFQAGLFEAVEIELEDGESMAFSSEIIRQTRSIPAKLGTKFGIRFSLDGKYQSANNSITYFFLTPGVIHPDKTRHDKYEVHKKLSASAPDHTIAFHFTSDYEVVAGIWRLMVFENDRLIVGESFAVGVDESLISTPPMKQPVTLKSLIQPVAQ